MGMPSVIELLILIIIGIFIWLFFKKVKKKTEKISSDNSNRKRNAKPKFCSECGAPLEAHEHFCPVCGTKVTGTDETDQKRSINNTRSEKIKTPPKESKKRSGFKLGLTVSAILIILIASYISLILYQTNGNLMPTVYAVSISSSDSSKLVSVGNDGYLETWDMKQGKHINRQKIPSGYGITEAAAWSQDNKIIAISRIHQIPIDNEIKLFDSNSLKQISTLSTGSSVTIALCFDPDGETLYSVTNRLGIGVWDLKEGKKLGGLEDLPDRLVTSASFDSDCQKIATLEGTLYGTDGFSTTDDRLMVYSRMSMDTLFDIKLDTLATRPSLIGLDFTGRSVSTMVPYIKKFQSWTIGSHRMREKVLDGHSYHQSLAMGKRNDMAIGCYDGVIDIFDASGKQKNTLRHGPGLGIFLEPILGYFD